MSDVKRGRGRPPKSATAVSEEKVITTETGVEVKKEPALIRFYNMYTDAIACGKPDNIEAVNKIDRPANGLVSEVDLLAAGVDIEWLKSVGILEEYGFLPTF